MYPGNATPTTELHKRQTLRKRLGQPIPFMLVLDAACSPPQDTGSLCWSVVSLSSSGQNIAASSLIHSSTWQA
jgi:hypothetical protein